MSLLLLLAGQDTSQNRSMSADWNGQWAPAMRDVAQAETENFSELIKIGGLDPTQHLRFADWTDLNFAGCDLRGFDFTGARLHGCDFGGARIAGARFDQAEIDLAETTLARGLSCGKNSVRTDLRKAADWDAYVTGWRRPERLVSDAHLRVGAVFQDAPFAPEMVVVPPGEFMMGSPPDEPGRQESEGPLHSVTIPQGFAVGRFPVTFDEWDFAQDDKELEEIGRMIQHRPSDPGWGRGRHPVINVSWKDARAYVKWLRAKTGRPYRLLSEAQWEYAARAGSQTAFSFGGSEVELDDYAWHASNSKIRTHPVGKKKPNAFGLYDVHGNVWEWVKDCWRGTYDDAPADGLAWTDENSSMRVHRGGSLANDPLLLRSAERGRNAPDFRIYDVGFRLSRPLNI